MGNKKTVPGRRVSLWEEGTIPSLKRIFFVPSFRKRISGVAQPVQTKP
jgi:hypothetical protein